MIAAFDLDGTLLKKNGSFAFCDFLCEKGFVSRADMLYYAYTYTRHCYFGLSFWDLHSRVFKRSFKGTPVDVLLPYVHKFLDERLEGLLYHPALFRLKSLRQRGFECMILSNSPRFIVEPIAKRLGVDRVYATEYQVDSTGKFSELTLLVDGEYKKEIILSMDSDKTIAFSDSHHDLPFLKAAHTAVAVNPRRTLRKQAAMHGWEIL